MKEESRGEKSRRQNTFQYAKRIKTIYLLIMYFPLFFFSSFCLSSSSFSLISSCTFSTFSLSLTLHILSSLPPPLFPHSPPLSLHPSLFIHILFIVFLFFFFFDLSSFSNNFPLSPLLFSILFVFLFLSFFLLFFSSFSPFSSSYYIFILLSPFSPLPHPSSFLLIFPSSPFPPHHSPYPPYSPPHRNYQGML